MCTIPEEGIKLTVKRIIMALFAIIACAPVISSFTGLVQTESSSFPSFLSGAPALLGLAEDAFYFYLLAGVVIAAVYTYARAVRKRKYEQEQYYQTGGVYR